MAKFKPVRIVTTKYGTNSLHFVTPRGRRRRLSVGKDYQHAQRMAVKFNDWLMEGKDPETEIEHMRDSEQLKMITLKDFFPVFLERHGKLRSPKMQISYRNSFKNVCRCPQFANAKLRNISKKLVLDFMHLRMEKDNVMAATVNVEWEMLDHNPLQGLKLFKDSGKRDVYLSPEQTTSLIRELPNPIDDIVEFAIYTGFRKENILSIRIESIRFHDLTLTGEVELIVKGGKRELFPLGPAATEVAKRAIGDRKRGYVFINPSTKTRYVSIHKTFDRAVRRLNLTIDNGTKLRFHDLRHTFSTWLHKSGVSLDSLRSLLGHRDRATTDRYTSVDRLETGKVLSLLPHLRKA